MGRQRAAGLRQEHRLLRRAGRPAHEVAVQVRAARPVGRSGLGDFSEHGPVCRRHGLPARLFYRDQQSFAGPVPGEHRFQPHGLSQRRRLGHVWAGHSQPESPGLRRDVRHAGTRAPQGIRAELGAGFLPGIFQGTALNAQARRSTTWRRPRVSAMPSSAISSRS